MSTIYRYLDVLSVEKCIDNINDFIKIKRIFIIMSVMLFLIAFLSVRVQFVIQITVLLTEFVFYLVSLKRFHIFMNF